MSGKPKPKIQVIGAGFGRTGTASLQLALEELLGGKCHHMKEVFARPASHLELWVQLSSGRPVDLDELFDGCVASCDFPSCNIYHEMADHWPDAKVVLTIRDPEKWRESVLETIYFTRLVPFESFGASFFLAVNSVLMPRFVRLFKWMNVWIWERVFFKGGTVATLQGDAGKALVQQRWAEWIADVKKNIPADRLLIFRVEDGWAPLCTFLNKPVPDKPFPKVNDRNEFRKGIVMMRAMWYGVPLLSLSAIGGCAFWIWRSNVGH